MYMRAKKWVSALLAVAMLTSGTLSASVMATDAPAQNGASTNATEDISTSATSSVEEDMPDDSYNSTDSTSTTKLVVPEDSTPPEESLPPADSAAPPATNDTSVPDDSHDGTGSPSTTEPAPPEDSTAPEEPLPPADSTPPPTADDTSAPNDSASGPENSFQPDDSSLPPDSSVGAEALEGEENHEGEAEATPQGVDVVTLGTGTPSASHANTLEDALDKVNADGTILVMEDIALRSMDFLVRKNVTIKSQAGTATLYAAEKSAVIIGAAGLWWGQEIEATLTLENIVFDWAGNTAKSTIITVEPNNTLMLGAGAVLKNSSGRGVLNGGQTTMQAGSRIENCSTDGSGGGIYNYRNLIIDGGSIIGCKATIAGNGIFDFGTTHFISGEIRECQPLEDTASNAAIYVLGSLQMDGGTIRDCSSGIMMGLEGQLDIKGGVITGCVSDESKVAIDTRFSENSFTLQGDVQIGTDANDNYIKSNFKAISITGPLSSSARINYECSKSDNSNGTTVAKPNSDTYPVLHDSDYAAFHFTDTNRYYYEFVDNIIKATAITVSITPNYKVIALGTSYTFKAVFSPDRPEYASRPLKWSTQSNRFTVDANGTVTAISTQNYDLDTPSFINVEDTISGRSTNVQVHIGQPIESMQLSESSFPMHPGDTLRLAAQFQPANAYNKTATWVSSDPDIVRLAYPNYYGSEVTKTVTALKPGTADIRVTSKDGNLLAVCTITVTEDPIPVQRVELIVRNRTYTTEDDPDINDLTVSTGDKLEFTASIYPHTADNKNIWWSISNSKIVDGYYHTDNPLKSTAYALKAGTATLRVTTEDGGFTTDCIIKVNAKTHAITFAQDGVRMTVGDKITVPAIALTYYGDKLKLKYRSSDKKIATVSSKGKITAVKTGSTTIEAIAADGEKTSLRVRVVTTAVPLQYLELLPGPLKASSGKYVSIPGRYAPSNATGLVFKWTSSNKKVARVNNFGAIWPIRDGTTVITVSAGGLSASTTLNVSVPVKKLSFAGDTVTLKKGKKITLKPKITLRRGYSYTQKPLLTWTSSKKSVATVNGKGTITAKKAGTTKITVKSANGKKATVKVTVKK